MEHRKSLPYTQVPLHVVNTGLYCKEASVPYKDTISVNPHPTVLLQSSDYMELQKIKYGGENLPNAVKFNNTWINIVTWSLQKLEASATQALC